MKLGINTLLFLFMVTVESFGANPTWSTSIANIIYSNCSSCHRYGGIAPFSLMNYDEVVAKKNSVLEAVTTRSMPPYPADTKFRSYSHQRNLSDSDINAFVEWVNNGAPAGDLASAPNPPTFSSGPIIKNPNITADMPLYASQAKAGG
ncbi:MAG: hypothetical protein ACK5DB_09160, partial [Ignavibacteria bacterium]